VLILAVRELSVLRLTEHYAEYGQVGFIAWFRADANLFDAGKYPVRSLVSPAS